MKASMLRLKLLAARAAHRVLRIRHAASLNLEERGDMPSPAE